MQGDVIARTAEVVEKIRQAHQYYADAPHYSHFVVLTQSCDLVKRRDQFNAPYITIAAAKPFKNTIEDFFSTHLKKLDGTDFSFQSSALLGRARQLLERHINNTEPEYFFLPKSGHPNLSEDLVVFLRLTIALRKDHYDTLAGAKIAELADVFQAKLGWLKGNIYSRVATPDIEERGINAAEIKSRFYEEYIPKDKFAWLSGLQTELLRKKVKAIRAGTMQDLTSDEVLEIIKNEIPEDVQIVANNIVEKLKKNNLLEGADDNLLKRFSQVISNDSSLKALVKAGVT